MPFHIELLQTKPLDLFILKPACTIPKVINFPRYNKKSSGDNEIYTTRNFSCSISFSSRFRVISRNWDYFLDSVGHKVHSVGTLMTKTQHVADIASIE